ncbi:MAG: protein kinase [Gemmataceae bacterium]|nr:protein kinase [Gemmataceae bacterium]
MRITLTVLEGPHKDLEFSFGRHDTFLVGRSKHAHFQLPLKDKYFSRIHFMIEMNPPQCRLVDMGSHNGTFVNGQKVLSADLKHGDTIRAGRSMLRLTVHPTGSDADFPIEMAQAETATAPRPQPAKAGAPASIPLQLPGYNLVREIGRGGMGVVYLATCKADGAQVAVKTVMPAVHGTPSHIQRFLREARILAELDHPHIVRFREMTEANGVLFFVMDYVAGTDAGKLVKKDGPMPVRRAVRLLCQILSALEYAHKKQFVHRDLKPSNLLVSEQGGKEIAKLADFGLARVYQASQISGLTITGDIGGTAAFMPPEQITNYRGAEPPADQYSAAATLYTLLTGRFVFDLPREIHHQFSIILEQKPVPIQSRRDGISDALAAAIHKALSRDAEQRFLDVRHFRHALIKAAKEGT